MALWAWNTALNWIILKESKSNEYDIETKYIVIELKEKMLSSLYGDNCFQEAFKDEMRVLVQQTPEHLQSLKNGDQYAVPKDWNIAPASNPPIFSVLFHKDRFECMDKFAEAEENLKLQNLEGMLEAYPEPELVTFSTIANDSPELQDEKLTYLASKRNYMTTRALKSLDLPSMHLFQGITKSRAEFRQAVEREALHQLQKEFPFTEVTKMTMQTPLQDAFKKIMEEVTQMNEEIERIQHEIEKLQTAQRSLLHKEHNTFPLLEHYEATIRYDREADIKQNISNRIYGLQAQIYELKNPSALSLLGCIQEYINHVVPSRFIDSKE